jgi:uncharacterized protein (DUF1800 family)
MKWKQFLAGLVAAAIMVPPSPGAPSQPFKTKLSGDKQVVHALDRLTFGARPGDYERVKRICVKKWIEQQLHPGQIPENALLDAKLRPLESLRMSSSEVAQHYPPPQMIRAIADGRQPMPDDPVLRASLTRLVARYRTKKGQAEDPSQANTLEGLEPARPVDQILDPAQIKAIRNGSLDQKRELLSQLTAADLDDLVIALPQPMRQQLFNAAPVNVRRKILLLRAPQQVVAYDLLESKLLRAVYSNRQLAEELDDFWFNHFNVFYDKGSDKFLIPSYERDAIRPNVLGSFRNLLEATAKSPAMLFYLDNFQSVRADMDAKAKNNKVKRGLNENYGRELLELHTLGVNGGYTQHDVIEVARCFTGWGIEQPRKGGGFLYNDKVHDKGEKVVLGHVIPAGGGMQDGEMVLDILASHPSTAKFISRKLAQRFVADNPPQALVDKMAKTFLTKKGDIREVMKVMLMSKEFWSEGAYRAKVKTPFEMVASAVRAVDANVDDAYALANQIGQLGEPLYRKQEPTGYSNLNADWVNSAALLGRLNFALNLTQNKVPGVKVDALRFESLSVHDLSAQTQATIDKATKDKQPATIAGLMLGSPEFQRK